MIKTLVMLKKRPDISFEQFTSHWANQHVSLVSRLPGIVRYVQNHIAAELQPEPAAFDGVGEAWFNGPAEFQAMLESDAYRRLIEDEEVFLDRAQLLPLVVRESEPLK